MSWFHLSRRSRRRLRRSLTATAWAVTLLATAVGVQSIIAWDEAREQRVRLGVAPVQTARAATGTEPVTAPSRPDVPPIAIPIELAAPPDESEIVLVPPTEPEPPEAPPAVPSVVPEASQAPPVPVVKAADEPKEDVPLPTVMAALSADEPAAGPEVGPPAEPVPKLVPPPEPEEPLPFEELASAAVPTVSPVPAIEPTPAVSAVLPRVRPRLIENALSAPTVAIVIDDMGYNERATRRLVEARRPLTLAFLPITASAEQAKYAKAAGLEILVHMPMEPIGHENPGRNAIKVGMPAPVIEALVEAGLSAVPGAIGLNNHMGSRATSDLASMQPVMATLARRGLFFLDSRTAGGSKAHAAALSAGVPAIGRDFFLDNEVSYGAIMRQLQAAERRARIHGYSVAIGHPHGATIDALLAWIPQAEARGIQLDRLSRLVPLDTCWHAPRPSVFTCEPAAVAAAEAAGLR
jgi:polysaccharide deacetylase 2 family uncharacterized protein YibQ